MALLRLDLKPGESVSIGGVAIITMEAKSGQTARVAIQADKSVPVERVQQPSAVNSAAKGGITVRP